MMRKNSEFTAIESAIAIGIVAVVVALVIAPYRKWNMGQDTMFGRHRRRFDCYRKIRKNGFQK
jgi:hypothetical protein